MSCCASRSRIERPPRSTRIRAGPCSPGVVRATTPFGNASETTPPSPSRSNSFEYSCCDTVGESTPAPTGASNVATRYSLTRGVS